MKKKYNLEIVFYEKKVEKIWEYKIKVLESSTEIITRITPFEEYFLIEQIEKTLLETKKKLVKISKDFEEADKKAHNYVKEVLLKRYYQEAENRGYIIESVIDKSPRGLESKF